MKTYLIGLTFISCLLTFHSCDEEAKIITTPLGAISGKRVNILEKSIDQYLGIPYTKPMSKENRYKKAEPIDRYETMIEANTMPPDCPQITYEEVVEKFGLEGNIKDDNCLFLNIWRPVEDSENTELKPVMFWIYGGGFQIGSISLDAYNGKVIAAIGDVIVVTVNYRIASFGFLTSGTEEEPGNLAFYDQNLGLRWVHDNIASFGGDPSQVTVFGESAGAVSSSIQMLSGKGEGLFKKAILQSGSYLTPVFFNKTHYSYENTLKLARKVYCATENEDFVPNRERIMNCLRNRTIDELTEGEKTLAYYPFLPLLEEEFVKVDDVRNFPKHFNKNVEVMIGVTEEEGNVMLITLFKKKFTDPEKMMKKTETLNFATDFLGGFFPNPRRLAEPYFENIDENDVVGTRTAFSNIISDFYFICPCIIFSDSYSAKGGLVHYYMMTHYSSKPSPLPDWIKSSHYTDVTFVFGEPLLPNSNSTRIDAEFARYIITTWTNFAKGRITQEWPAFTPSSDMAFELSPHRNSTINIPRAQFCYDVWKPAFEEKLDRLERNKRPGRSNEREL